MSHTAAHLAAEVAALHSVVAHLNATLASKDRELQKARSELQAARPRLARAIDRPRCAGNVDDGGNSLCGRGCAEHSPRAAHGYCDRLCGLRDPIDLQTERQLDARPPPQALLYLHPQKTGGTSVRSWMARQAHATPPSLAPRLSIFWDAVRAACFVALHRDLLVVDQRNRAAQGLGSMERDAKSLAELRVSWEYVRVAVEFHTSTADIFLSRVLPNLPALAARYEAAGGRLLVVTTVRQPVSHLISAFDYKGPRWDDAPDPAAPFTECALRGGGASGLQVGGFVTVGSGSGQRRQALRWHGFGLNESYVNDAGCEPSTLSEARAALARFDLVGLTECLPQLFRAIERRLELPHEPQAHSKARESTSHASPPPIQMEGRPRPAEQFAHRVWPRLSLQVQGQIQATLRRCDGALFDDARHRCAAELGPSCARAVGVGVEHI